MSHLKELDLGEHLCRPRSRRNEARRPYQSKHTLIHEKDVALREGAEGAASPG
jgi:hypothetical protein